MDINELAQRLTARWIAICARRGRYPREPSPTELITLHILLQAIISGTPGPGSGIQPSQTNQIVSTIQNLDRQMDMYERPDLLDQAMENIPLQDLHERAEKLQASNEPLPCFEDALADVLVKWFRDDYFVWVDRKTEKCPVCRGPMQFDTSPQPTAEELRGGGNRVELHKCKKPGCEGQYRFPRYNDPSVLMKTRVGRCGEFANLFTVFLRAMGLRAQYVWNLEDHVWNAYFSPAQQRWIHLDSCEAARDQPLLYSKGWGKKMSFCLAFSTEGATDVSRGYIQTEKWEDAMKTRASFISESELEQALAAVTRGRRTGLPQDVLSRLEDEDRKMKEWLQNPEARGDQSHLEPRQSGSEDWKKIRGEAGPSDSK